ncbi:hypothetical protein OAH97_00720 [Octadecabacter sp.]|nr:hypothetical protein [Octadecabacter sp.]
MFRRAAINLKVESVTTSWQSLQDFNGRAITSSVQTHGLTHAAVFLGLLDPSD